KGDPIVLDPKNPASLGYRNIARRILGETVPLMSFKKEKKNFFQKIFGK
ncbi:MAG: septum site-determining protein MinD, partial [Carnobacterium sp.]